MTDHDIREPLTVIQDAASPEWRSLVNRFNSPARMVCSNCGGDVPLTYSYRRYCSNRCRNKINRLRAKERQGRRAA